MKIQDAALLVILAAIWGSSFVFMRATADVFGPIMLVAIRVGVAALAMFLFLVKKQRRQEFIQNWKVLFIIGLLSSAIPFTLLSYASLTLTGGTVSILNAMTPIFTTLIAHFWLKERVTKYQLLGIFVSVGGLFLLIGDKVTWTLSSWLPILAGLLAALNYGFSSTTTKKYLGNVSAMTSAAGSLFFSAITLLILAQFFWPDFTQVTPTHWSYAIVLGLLCTAIAYVILFKLILSVGPTITASVTFLIPVFAFLWGYLLLGEVVTLRMLIATGIIILGMGLITGIIKFTSFAK